jgi:hypothetical protein
MPGLRGPTVQEARLLAAWLLALAGLPAQLPLREETWEDGSPRLRYSVDREGRRSGVCREFAPEGWLMAVTNWSQGLLEGRAEEFFPDGKLAAVRSHRRGKLHGNVVELDESGKRRLVGSYLDGEKHGRFEAWHEDGGRALIAEYQRGRRHGAYEERSADGSRVRTARYAQDLLDGPAQLVRAGRPPVAQVWKAGRLLSQNGVATSTRTEAEVRASLAAILDPVGPADPSSLDAARAAALARLRAYRYLAGVPHENVTLDPQMNEACQAAAEVCTALGSITHTPRDPGGLAPGRYELGKLGAGSSNLSMGTTLPHSIDRYMDDSDASNIRALGHRRWCLNPRLARTGFGHVSGVSAMWALDASGPALRGTAVVSWPPPGPLPVDFIEAHWAWTFAFAGPGSRVAVVPSVIVERLGEDYLPVEEEPITPEAWAAPGGYGMSPCVACRPPLPAIEPGASVLVSVSLDSGKTWVHSQITTFVAPLAP